MFEYKLKNRPISTDSTDFMLDYLRALGIQKTSSFLNEPSPEDELDPFLLDNMDAAVGMLYKHLKRGSSIFLVVDSDVDGYTSSAIIYNYIADINSSATVEYHLHPEKEHGVFPSTVPYGTDLVIIPDAGGNQSEDLKELEARGIDILVLDHHLVNDGELYITDKVITVNNQISANFPNKHLSGAGIVYKFTQAFDKTHGCTFSKKYVDLAMLGIVSDMMLITDLDNNSIIRKGLDNINSKMFRALLQKQSYSVTSVTKPTIIDIVFYVTPIINGTIRMGDAGDKAMLFNGFITPNSTETFTHTWRGESTQESLYDMVARESMNTRNKQNRVTEKTMEGICEIIDRDSLNLNQVILYETSKKNIDEVQKSLTGLVAMKILQKYNKPTLILRPVQDNGVWYYRGSGRGKKVKGFPSFKDFLSNSGIMDYAQG